MKNNMLLLAAISMLAACSSQQSQPTVTQDEKIGKETTMIKKESFPSTERIDVVNTLHGVDIHDSYQWLEDVKNEKVQTWMNEQDTYTRAELSQLPEREMLKKRFAELYYVDSVRAPNKKGNRFFYSRRHADKEKAIYYWREGEEGAEKILLDPNTMSKDGSTSVGGVYPSRDGKKVAYTLRAKGGDESTMYLMDVSTGKVSDIDIIPGAKYAGPSWTPDSKGFYYTWLPVDPKISTSERPGFSEVRFHKLGTDPLKDEIIKEKIGDAKKFHGVDLSRDGRYLLYYVWHGWTATDVYYRDLKSKSKSFKPIVVGKKFQYSIESWKGNFYIYTNEGAPRFKIMKASAKKPTQENWKEIVSEFSDGSVIKNLQIVGGHVVLTLLSNVYSKLRVHDLQGKLVRDIKLPGIGATFGMTGQPDSDTAYFGFQSFTVPSRIFKTKISTGEADLWTKVEVPIQPEDFKVEQVWFTSKDGTKVPMFVITKKGIKKDGSTPFILSGYGGFNVSLYPYFRASIFPWLEAGGGYAIPNLRGGGEFGEEWHQAGMREKKQNVFDDFIAAAEYLIDNKYTQSSKLAIRGGSNGGLLVGAAMVQRPDLFKAVICAVPLLDMVRYHKFGSGMTWISEYGSADNEEEFKYIYAYSPYHHIVDENYPSLLMLSADNDDRVDPMHARKFVAAIQHHSKSGHPVLLRIEKNAGHGGADLIREYIQTDTDTYSFLFSELGLR